MENGVRGWCLGPSRSLYCEDKATSAPIPDTAQIAWFGRAAPLSRSGGNCRTRVLRDQSSSGLQCS